MWFVWGFRFAVDGFVAVVLVLRVCVWSVWLLIACFMLVVVLLWLVGGLISLIVLVDGEGVFSRLV